MYKKFLIFLIIIVFSLYSVSSLFHSGLPPTHDGEYHVVRSYEFYKALQDGNIYPRWAADLNKGYGIPLFNYVYPLPNYTASFFHMVGFSFIDSFKINLIFATIVGGIFFYLWAKEIWGTLGGIVSAIFFIYSPYRLVDIYVRGSVGEVWALAFLPGTLLFVTKVVKKPSVFYSTIAGICLALVILSHNILGLMFFLFTIFYMGMYLKNKKITAHFFYILVLSLSISSIFWIPALLEKSYVTGLQIYNLAENFPEIYQLLIPSWGSGFFGSGLNNEMSVQIGIGNLLVVLMNIGALPYLFLAKRQEKKIIVFLLVAFSIAFYLLIKQSIYVWTLVPLLNYFQFPWRLLSLEIVIASFLAGSIPFCFENSGKKIISLVISIFMIFLVVVLDSSYTVPAYYLERNDTYYTTRPNFIDGTNSPGNLFNTIWFNSSLQKKSDKLVAQNPLTNIHVEKISTDQDTFLVTSASNTIFTANIAYFPGWVVYDSLKKIAHTKDKDGLISFILSSGTHSVSIKKELTLVELISSLITCLSLLWIVYVFIKQAYVRIPI